MTTTRPRPATNAIPWLCPADETWSHDGHGLKSLPCAAGAVFDGWRVVREGIQSTAVGLRRNSDTLPAGPSIDSPVIVETPSIFSYSSDPRVIGWSVRRPFSSEKTRY